MGVKEAWEMSCPQCGEDHKIDIEIVTEARLAPDGTDLDESQNHDHEWDPSSVAHCRVCDFSGLVWDFQTRSPKGSRPVVMKTEDVTKFVQLIANFTPSKDGEDSVATINGLIDMARKLVSERVQAQP